MIDDVDSGQSFPPANSALPPNSLRESKDDEKGIDFIEKGDALMKSIVTLILSFICSLNGLDILGINIGFGAKQENPQPAVEAELKEFDLEEMIKEEDINDLTLTIYAIMGSYRYRIPPNAEQVKNGYEAKVEVTGEELAKNIELFYEIKSSALTQVFSDEKISCDIVYVLESEKNGVLLEVAFWYMMWNTDIRTVQLNGAQVKEEQFLYDIVKTYASEEILNKWEPSLNVNNVKYINPTQR